MRSVNVRLPLRRIVLLSLATAVVFAAASEPGMAAAPLGEDSNPQIPRPVGMGIATRYSLLESKSMPDSVPSVSGSGQGLCRHEGAHAAASHGMGGARAGAQVGSSRE